MTSAVCLSLALAIAASSPAPAQDPVIVPETPGENLPAGELPALPGSLPGEVVDPLDVPVAPRTAPLEAATPPSPDLGFGVTGDWFGARTALVEDGINLRTNFTQFYQGVTTGGLDQRFDYGLKFDYFGIIEAEKLLGIKGLLINLHGESRFGETINNNDGSLLPSNFALQFPQGFGSASALTNMQIQQFLSPNWLVTFGKLNTADGVNIHPFMGGYGTDRFMNTAFILNPIYGRAIPYSTPGAGFSYLRDLDPVFTFLVVDPMGQPDTAGLANLFNNGASLFGQLRLPVAPAGLRGHQGFEFAYSSGKFNPLSGNDYVIIGPGLIQVNRQTGTWVASYAFDQFLWIDEANPARGVGIFGNLSMSDGDPNPIRWFLNAGIAGTSPLPGRDLDSFGLAYYYLGVSDSLKTTLDPIFPVRNEQGFELYYNAAVTKWFMMTADIQAIDPARRDADSAFLFGLRAKIIF